MPDACQPPATVQELLDRCQVHVVTLRRSAMFAMSRGAKELFHTNFLAFVLELDVASLDEADQTAVAQAQKALLTRLFGAPAPDKVVAWREVRRLDLVLAAQPETDPRGKHRLNRRAALDGQPARSSKTAAPLPDGLGASVVIIEAKLKAVPDAEQLQRYDQVLHAGLCLELEPEHEFADRPKSPAWGRLDVKTLKAGSEHASLRAYPPTQSNQSAQTGAATRRCIATGHGQVHRVLLAPADHGRVACAAGWRFLPWSDLLDDFDASTTGKQGAVAAMLHDYACSTRALLAVLQEVADFVGFGFARAGNTLQLRDVTATPARFQSLRIHDVIGKYAFSVLQTVLTETLNSRGIRQCVGDWRLEAEVFMTRGMPGLCIEYRLGDPAGHEGPHVSLGVQIQSNAYRHYISASHPSMANSELSLQDLTKLVGSGNSLDGSWWALETAADKPLKKFNADGFLYADVDAASWAFERLQKRVTESMTLAVSLVQDEHFCEAARELLRSRRRAP